MSFYESVLEFVRGVTTIRVPAVGTWSHTALVSVDLVKSSCGAARRCPMPSPDRRSINVALQSLLDTLQVGGFAERGAMKTLVAVRHGRPGRTATHIARTRTMQSGPRILSLKQPGAWAVAAGKKKIENRTWSTPYRGDCIHPRQQQSRSPALDWLRNQAVPMGIHRAL